MDTTIITGPVAENVEELTRKHDAAPLVAFQWRDRGMVLVSPVGLAFLERGTLTTTDHEPDDAEGLAELFAAPDVAARTYTLDMGDGTDRVVAIYRQSDRFGYAWNLSDLRQSEYGYILD